MRIVSWNMKWNGDQARAWQMLREMDADVALLQEAVESHVPTWAEVSPGPWRTSWSDRRPWRTAVAKLSDRVDVEFLEPIPLGQGKRSDFTVSHDGTLAAAVVTPRKGAPLTVVSMYAAWEGFSQHSGRRRTTLAMPALHRAISDLTRLVGPRVRLIAAGDLNIYRRSSQKATPWRWNDGGRRGYGTAFDRMEAIGVPFVGPTGPEAGRQPTNASRRKWGDVLTFYTPRQGSPAKATQQLDFAFATKNLHRRLAIRALNDVDGWGPSDHCRILIDLDARRNAANAASSSAARAQADLSKWSCDQCSTTIDDLIARFGKKYPTEDPVRYLPRIVGGHKAHHTRQARRATR